MHATYSPISVPAESRHHLTPVAVSLAFAVLALGVTTTGHDAPVPQRQQQVRFEVVGYGNNV